MYTKERKQQQQQKIKNKLVFHILTEILSMYILDYQLVFFLDFLFLFYFKQ
jgi:hypothetical protein